MNYILDGHEPRRAASYEEWVRWMIEHRDTPRSIDPEGMDDCRVGSTRLSPEVWVSTVFSGRDDDLSMVSPSPVCFETMIFGGPLDSDAWRYRTWDEAAAGHEAAVALAREAGIDRG